jgi:hypothetical protein
VEGPGRTETTRGNLTGNWTGQWKRGVTTSLNFTQATASTVTPGPIRSDGTTRSIQSTVRFRIAPKGGLRLPLLGSRGVLKSGIDVSVTGAYNTDNRKRFNDPSQPGFSVPESETSAIQLGVRGDYTLTRNMTGGIDLGYTRNHSAVGVAQTVTLIRLGFNIALVF